MLKNKDPKIFEIIKKEYHRQESDINLIASENYTDISVLEAAGSVMTNKYAEGYPGKRYYGGCQFVDEAELLAIERCKKLFHAEHVNVQPHSGSQANMAGYFSILNPGDKIMGMRLSEGGHLTHGHPVNFSGKFYDIIPYGVNKETEQIDFDEIEKLANEHKPKLIVVGASAYPREINFKKFSEIAKSIGAYLLTDIAHIAGLVATGLHQSPVGYADLITSTTHKTLRGPRGGLIMSTKELGEKIDKSVMPGIQGGPFMNVVAAKAVAFELALQKDFVSYQKQVVKNTKAMAEKFKQLGYRLVSGGTDNHLILIDLRNKNIKGDEAEHVLSKVGIYVNRNTIPFDTEKPWIGSGIRIGTPAITTRGLKEADVELVTQWIDEALQNKNDNQKLEKIKKEVLALCNQNPIYKKTAPKFYGAVDITQEFM